MDDSADTSPAALLALAEHLDQYAVWQTETSEGRRMAATAAATLRALAAPPAITDEMVEMAAHALWRCYFNRLDWLHNTDAPDAESWANFRADARAALEAALTPKEPT